MPVDLNAPLSWETAAGDDLTMLQELQPNIVRAHVRDSLHILFLQFDDGPEGRQFLGALTGLMKSAKQHLDEVKNFKATGVSGSPYVGLGLTRAGYDTLGLGAAAPADSSFGRGMKAPASRTDLHDPPAAAWEVPYRADIHAVVLIGDADEAAASARRDAVLDLLPGSVTILGEEKGDSLFNDNGDGIEHFGYVDGRSQPLFLTEDIDDEKNNTDGINAWDPSAPLHRVLVADPGSDPALHFGSYFVFRKLEQNVRRFKQGEEDLADSLGLSGEDRGRAGAMLVGRFEDGTPLTLQADEGAHVPVMNNFTYDSDGLGAKCPFHAHIRKTNPRGSGGPQTPEAEKQHLMARRGQTYGQRLDDPNDESLPPSARPAGGVGLLFMAFNANINIQDSFGLSQFDFTQKVWANNPNFPAVPAGAAKADVDPVIGQGTRGTQDYPDRWAGDSSTTAEGIPQAVHMRGGEYFFMPSLATLRGLITP